MPAQAYSAVISDSKESFKLWMTLGVHNAFQIEGVWYFSTPDKKLAERFNGEAISVDAWADAVKRRQEDVRYQWHRPT